jgi:trimeric autotransporter adhesin
MYSVTQLKQALFLMVLAGFGFLPVQAVVPPPDGGYPNFTTAEGQNALFSLTTGAANTAVGWFSLFSDTEGSFNTATGAGALLFNTADQNTAFGAAALLFNTTGFQNTAVGAAALLNNTEGGANTAIGDAALRDNTTGFGNTATGVQALLTNTTGDTNTANGNNALANNTTGDANTATGYQALLANTTSNSNTANGSQALRSNATGGGNTANGAQALYHNIIGANNTANGVSALFNNDGGSGNTANGYQALVNNINGSSNTAAGQDAGFNITGNGNVCIGANVSGAAGVNNTTWIRNVYGSVASDRAVYVNSDNKVGTLASSRRYKEQIKSMDKASEAILALKPVTFRYKQELDPHHVPMFGLIAEDVGKVNPDLVTRSKKGEVETVRYDAVNAMLLNEFLKEHRKNEEQQATIARLIATDTRQQKQIEALTAALQKVSAQIELTKPTPQTVLNNR